MLLFLYPLQNLFGRNDKSEPISHLEDVVRIIIRWSEWRDLNPRPLGPESLSRITRGAFWHFRGLFGWKAGDV